MATMRDSVSDMRGTLSDVDTDIDTKIKIMNHISKWCEDIVKLSGLMGKGFGVPVVETVRRTPGVLVDKGV